MGLVGGGARAAGVSIAQRQAERLKRSWRVEEVDISFLGSWSASATLTVSSGDSSGTPA